MRTLTTVDHLYKTFWASLCIYLHTLVALWPPIDFSLNLTKQKKNVQQQRAFSFYSKSLFSLCNCICILWAKRNECRILLILAGLIDPSFSTARQSSLHGDILAVLSTRLMRNLKQQIMWWKTEVPQRCMYMTKPDLFNSAALKYTHYIL